jgi:putative DNA methylase
VSNEPPEFEKITPASAIETEFPFRRLNRLAALESYNKHHYRPTNYQHKWWARRLGTVFRMISLATLSESGTTSDDLWEQFATPNQFDDALVFDPFMGGGTTGQETTRLGAKFVGSDVNPVAWFISRMGLAPRTSLLETYFRNVVNRSRNEIRPYYRTTCPECGDEAGMQFCLWVQVVEYTNVQNEPQLGREYDSLVVDHGRDGGATVVCPNCHDVFAVDAPEEAVCDECDHRFDATRENVRVPIDSPTVVFNGGERPAYEPYAVKYDCEGCDGNGFKKFDRFDVERFEAARERFGEIKDQLPLPEQEIPEGGEKTRDLHNRNYTKWTHLFNARQLLALGTLLKNIREVNDDLARQYLVLTFSATLEFNNMFCSYKGADPRGPGAVRHIFSHHAYVHPKEPLENNPLGTQGRQSGTFRYLYEYRLKKSLDFQTDPTERVLDEGTVAEKRSIEGERIGGAPADTVDELLNENSTHFLACGDSADLPFADELAGEVDAVITDPPYYDSVQYSELADFFYVWLRLGLGDIYPEQFDSETISKEREAVGNVARDSSLEDYRAMLQAIYEQCHELLADDGPLVFTFHHKRPEAWGAVLQALDAAGFRVVQTYPVHGENRLSVHINGQRAVLLDSVIVCRKDHKKPEARWDAVYDDIARDTRERVRSFHTADDDDLSRLDASVVAYGVCMQAFSKYERVLDAEDTVISERDAMERIQPLIEELNETEL